MLFFFGLNHALEVVGLMELSVPVEVIDVWLLGVNFLTCGIVNLILNALTWFILCPIWFFIEDMI
jgi:hypothetical protein